MEALTFNPSTLESEAGQSVVQGQPGLQTSAPGKSELHSETMTHIKQNKLNICLNQHVYLPDRRGHQITLQMALRLYVVAGN